MKFPARYVAGLLPLLLTACYHWPHHAQQQATAPSIQPAPQTSKPPAPTVVQPPVGAIPTQPITPASSATITPQQQPKPEVHHHKPVNKNVQQASNGEPAVSAIGQLSSGDPTELRRETDDSIVATERGLNGINRTLSYQEQKTASQIREFLKQARAALASGDVDGAHTLVLKAKVLLSELNH
jgi:hypothetical protein